MICSLKRGLALAAACLAMSASFETATADMTVYVTTANPTTGVGDFGTLDLDTGIYTRLGAVGSTGPIYAMGLGADGNLYGIDHATDTHLYRINTASGAGTDLGSIGRSVIGGGAGPHGSLVALSDDTSSLLYSLNPPDRATTPAGAVGFTGGGLVAVNAAGQIFIDNFVPVTYNDVLYSVDPTNGTATAIGNGIGADIYTGFFINGTLYGLSAENAIYTIDTTTGLGTFLRNSTLDTDQYYGAIASVPEPSSLVMLALGAVALAGHRRARRRSGRRAVTA